MSNHYPAVSMLNFSVPAFLIGSQMLKLVVTLCVMLPISLLRNISKLEKVPLSVSVSNIQFMSIC